jgi:hypothetical protein
MEKMTTGEFKDLMVKLINKYKMQGYVYPVHNGISSDSLYAKSDSKEIYSKMTEDGVECKIVTKPNSTVINVQVSKKKKNLKIIKKITDDI